MRDEEAINARMMSNKAKGESSQPCSFNYHRHANESFTSFRMFLVMDFRAKFASSSSLLFLTPSKIHVLWDFCDLPLYHANSN